IIPGCPGQATGPTGHWAHRMAKTIIQSGRRLLFCRKSLIRRPVRRARGPVGWPIARANLRIGVWAEMKFDLPSGTRRIFEQARQFAEANLANRDRCIGLDRIGWRAAADFGWFQRAGGPAGRGGGRGALASVAMLEGMGRGGADRGLLFAIGAHLFGSLVPLSIHAGQSQAAQWLAPLRDGTVIGALAVTEVGGGSSFEHIETTLVETTGGYVLSGRKTLIGDAPEAGVFLVLARQFPSRGPLGLTALLVPADVSGLTVTPIATAGLSGLPMGDVVFDQCFVPADAVLGGQGAGLRVFATAMQ